MRKRSTRAALTIGVAAAATLGLIAAGTALAHPQPEDPDVYTKVNAPDAVAGDATGDGVAFEPVIGNKTGAAVTDVRLSLTLASADEGVAAQLAVESADERCEVSGSVVTCEVAELAAETTRKLKLRLKVVDADSWKTHPVTTFDAALSGGGTDTDWDSTYTHSPEVESSARLGVELPDSAFPYDAGEPVGGTEVHFTLNNDSGQRLEDATLTVEVEGRGEKPTLKIDSRRYRDCDETVDFTMTCEIDFIYHADHRTFDTRLYTTNAGQEENDSVLKLKVTWTDAEGKTHTFAQTRADAIVFPAEG